MKFYGAKFIHLYLGICRESLEKYVRTGFFPMYEQSPDRSNGVGYFENTFEVIKSIKLPKKGRPIKDGKFN